MHSFVDLLFGNQFKNFRLQPNQLFLISSLKIKNGFYKTACFDLQTGDQKNVIVLQKSNVVDLQSADQAIVRMGPDPPTPWGIKRQSLVGSNTGF